MQPSPLGSTQVFKQEHVSDKLFEAMKAENTFNEKVSPVSRERLRLLTITHVDFKSDVHAGQLIVLDVCADGILAIFKALYQRRFPLAKVRLMHHYGGGDDKAVPDNNTSCHNCRVIKDTTVLSLHAYGAAIDKNPVQNPCVYIDEKTGIATYDPIAGIKYGNRLLKRLGKNYRDGMAEEVVDIFAEHGFYWWGGYWDTPLDYNHFELGRRMTALYVAMEPEIAKEVFQKVTRYFNQHKKPVEPVLSHRLKEAFSKDCSLAEYYEEYPGRFMELFNQVTDI